MALASNIAYLQDYGPVVVSELPNGDLSVRDRSAGAQTFTVLVEQANRTTLGRRPSPVAYLPAHAKPTVLETFLQANQQVVDRTTRRGFHAQLRAHGSSWVAAAGEITDKYWVGSGAPAAGATDAPVATECPICGTEIERNLPAHITDCANRG